MRKDWCGKSLACCALGWLPLLVLLAAQRLPAQSQPPANGTISVDVNLVVLHAAVYDKKHGFVTGLKKDNFQVTENGQPQTIQFFSSEDMPVAVGLVVDNSGSMGPKRDDVVAAAQAFVDSSNPQDQVFVVNFNERVSLGLPDQELFSADPAELTQALKGTPARGMTALYDALDFALNHLRKASLQKKVLIVISDGGDNASHLSLEQVLEAASRSDAVIYTIGLFDPDSRDKNPGVLKKIARATGGEFYAPDRTSKVFLVCQQIAKDIRSQYTIAYAPTNSKLDNTYRTVRVIATGPRGHKYEVRTREGYTAAPKPGA